MDRLGKEVAMRFIRSQFFGVLVVVLFSFSLGWSHCEIPCGIYDDDMRVDMLAEHITTIEKAMKQIIMLQKENPINYNQLVRWITNKEQHAQKFQHIISRYFMTQRIKLAAKDYQKKISVLHHMLVYAMRCKQTTDLSNIESLRKLIKQFRELYFEQ